MVADESGGVLLIDITDPAFPSLAGTYDSTGVAAVSVAPTLQRQRSSLHSS